MIPLYDWGDSSSTRDLLKMGKMRNIYKEIGPVFLALNSNPKGYYYR